MQQRKLREPRGAFLAPPLPHPHLTGTRDTAVDTVMEAGEVRGRGGETKEQCKTTQGVLSPGLAMLCWQEIRKSFALMGSFWRSDPNSGSRVFWDPV